MTSRIVTRAAIPLSAILLSIPSICVASEALPTTEVFVALVILVRCCRTAQSSVGVVTTGVWECPIASVARTSTALRRTKESSAGPSVSLSQSEGQLLAADIAGGTTQVNLVVATDYDLVSGTSFSGRHVAAVAALVMSVNPDLSPIEVRKIIENTAEPLGPTLIFGNGMVRADRAVNAVQYKPGASCTQGSREHPGGADRDSLLFVNSIEDAF